MFAASVGKVPFLRQAFGYAVAPAGSAALSQKHPAGRGAAAQKSVVVCRPQQGGYLRGWSYQLNGAHHSGHVLVAVTASSYRLGKVAQAAPASPAPSLSLLRDTPITGRRSQPSLSQFFAGDAGHAYSAVTVSSARAASLAATVRSSR
jgi:hypothetical protein